MTRQCNLPEGFAASAAIAAEPEAASLSTALGTLFGMTDAQRRVMGAKGRKLVEERFTWPQVARQMKDVYDWILGGGNRPPFISTC
jgi:poly(glycerol-phosphate) alpha-glucosyltransferase